MQAHIFGIDVGKTSFYVATALSDRAKSKYPVTVIEYKNPQWRDDLRALIPASSVVLLEATGTNYAMPLINTLSANCRVLIANNNITANVRRLHISAAKSDTLDARALAALALEYLLEEEANAARSEPSRQIIRGVYPLRYEYFVQRRSLRFLMLEYKRSDKERTRTLNRLDAILHSIAPEYVAIKEQMAKNHVLPPLPEEKPPHIHGKTWNAMQKHRPPEEAPLNPIIEATLNRLYDTFRYADAEKEQLKADVEAAVKLLPLWELWATIPGMSPMLAAAALSAADPLTTPRDSFKRAIGQAPLRNQSGARDQTTFKKRAGNRIAMQYLHLATMSAVENSPTFGTYRRTHSFSATKRKYAAVMWGVANSGTPFVEHL